MTLIAQRELTFGHGIPTRCCIDYFTPPEKAIHAALVEVEKAGASPALTDASMLLTMAQGRVADHVEALPAANEYMRSLMPRADAAEKLYSQAELDAAVTEAVDRALIANFMLFAKNLPDNGDSLVYGTSSSARSVMRALEKAGYK